MKRIGLRNPVKEAIDHLPCGICFFDENGSLVLCNILMYQLAFSLIGHDLQTETDLSSALEILPENSAAIRDGESFRLPDGTVWQFSCSAVHDEENKTYNEYIAANVTELYEQQQKLKQSSEEQKKLATHMRRITKNIIEITREEEILSMKMQIHGEVGWCLQSLRQYYTEGCPADGKKDIVKRLRKITATLHGEIGHDDELDVLDELIHTAALAGANVNIYGEVPKSEDIVLLVTAAIRECLTNTLYHAGGDEVSAVITKADSYITVCITNNGNPPKETIIEGGGLTSLRRRIEKAGGRFLVKSLPRFVLDITIPIKEDAI